MAPAKIIYKQVGKEEGNKSDQVFYTIEGQSDDDDEYDEGNKSTDEFILDADEDAQEAQHHHLEVMEISSGSFDEDFSAHLFGWKDPWLPAGLLALFIHTPTLIGAMLFTIEVLGVWFAIAPFALHLLLILGTARYMAHTSRKTRVLESFRTRIYGSVVAIIDILFTGILYPVIVHLMDSFLLTETDGFVSSDWIGHRAALRRLLFFSVAAAVCRILLGINAIGLRSATSSMDSSFTNTPSFVDRWCKCPSYVLAPFLYIDSFLQRSPIMCNVPASRRKRIRDRFICVLDCSIVIVFFLFAGAMQSTFRHLVRQSPPSPSNTGDCDTLDETECWLPFPSFHHMKKDATTATSWRLNLQGNQWPPLRTGRELDPSFLNELDGFSTMGPILFYIDGLKEAHEAGLRQLKGIREIDQSTTKHSATLLLDVQDGKLVPHSAEVDYLDTAHPMVMVFPSQPLYHNRHYALAVVNAKDAERKRIAPAPGLSRLLEDPELVLQDNRNEASIARRARYIDVLIPSLEKAAHWMSYAKDPQALQLLFDFQTISEESQLGTIRSVRDVTVQTVSSAKWNWVDHVKTLRTDDFSCESSQLARTVHAELDVPWFLDRIGNGSRGAILKDITDKSGAYLSTGTARLLVHIPCSVKRAALDGIDSDRAKPLRAVVEYGHGLFSDRAESQDAYMVDLANKEGYILIAMDWRGMSRYDLLNIVKVLISRPSQFRAMRDNIIQGFANKFALQHFATEALPDCDWLSFLDSQSAVKKVVPAHSGKKIPFVFYGVSQGGILGAGYTALSGKIDLVDRSILTSAGTPFTFIMTRSTDFVWFDLLFRLNFFNNRHVRSILALVQLGWDPAEGSGTLALPVNEPIPQVLLQAGLGDPTVGASSSESLARAFNATTLPGSPRTVFGLSAMTSSDQYSPPPKATFTEILYTHEYASSNEDNFFPDDNPIHYCLRGDPAILSQLAVFVNTGSIEDPCIAESGCERSYVQCFGS